MCQAVPGTWRHYCIDTSNNSRKVVLLHFTNGAQTSVGGLKTCLSLPYAYRIPIQGSLWYREGMGGWRPTLEPWPF